MTSVKPNFVTMRVRVGEAELEVTGPQRFVENKIAEFLKEHRDLSAKSPAKQHVKGDPSPLPQVKKRTSIAQFFRSISPKSAVDKALAVGYYLEKVDELESFTAAEIRDKIKQAKEPPPKNPSDVVNQNIKKGHMMAAGDKGGKMAFVLTTDGERQVEKMISQSE